MAVNPVPEGFHSVTPYLVVDGASGLIDFAKQAFHAQEIYRMAGPDGKIGHAVVKIGDSMVMISDARPPHSPIPAMLYLYLKDTDAAYDAAIKAGATSIMAPTDQFYGDRNAGVIDPFGNQWWIGTHIEDVSEDEIQKRAATAAPAHA